MTKKLLKILAIDDMPANLALLGNALKNDYRLQIAASGPEGLHLAQQEPPDLILLDVMMPGMDGYETCRLLKADSVLQNIPVIFVTALSEPAAETKGLALGAVDYLSKPLNLDIACLRIRNLLEREQMRKEILRQKADLLLSASVFAHSHDGIIITDAENHIIEVNKAFERITGYSRKEVLGKNPRLLKSGMQPVEFYRNMWQSLLENDCWNGELWDRNKQGEIYAALSSISIVRDAHGEIHHHICMFADITPQKNYALNLERIAHFDPLTGIPNRILLADRLAQAILQSLRTQNFMAVCYLDLDGFKPVNDHFGHDVGDQLLIEISRRIRDSLRAGDTLARFGGDEFVLLVLDLKDLAECKAVLKRTLQQIAEPVVIEGHLLAVSASLGYTLFPGDDADADTLLRHADQAMYIAKQSGKNRCHLFDALLDRRVMQRSETIAQIEAALRNHEFVLYFQPKVNMRSGRVWGVEALIRWRHPERGLLPPAEFLPIIENSDLMAAVGNWVFYSAFAHMQIWQDQGLQLLTSVNVAPHHLLRPDFVENLKTQLADYPGLHTDNLELEILETAMLEDMGLVSGVMNECHKLGIAFALDDFGTGYSSLTYLKALPAATLKIDQSFVRDLLSDPEDCAIVEGIINLSATFHRQVIAEGVETIAHGVKLLQLGCENAQGYGIARPMPAEKLADWIKSWKAPEEWQTAY